MAKEFKTLQECKEEVAKKSGLEKWDYLCLICEGLQSLETFRNEAAEMYAKQWKDESFMLSAQCCDKPYGDDYGNKRCEYQDEIIKLNQRIKDLEAGLPIERMLNEKNRKS